MDRRDTESETDSDSDNSYEESLELSRQRLAGPDFTTFAKQLSYDKSVYTPTDYYSPYTSTRTPTRNNTLVVSNDTIPADTFNLYGNSKFETVRKEVNTLFMIDSKDRDQNVYPQPTHFTLKPPRIYRNVVNIQLSQLKFLTSFYYFNASKGNVMVPVRELGRAGINRYNGLPLTEAIQIPDGTYTISELLAQLQLQMNSTPLFYDFPGGFNDFIGKFTVNGDLSLNFNQPGDSYYDSLNKLYIKNPAMTQIVSYYWPSQYAGLSTYTLSQVQTAYYFPVLYEAVLDTTDTTVFPNLNLTLTPSLEAMIVNESVTNYIIYNSSGLNDPIIAYIISNNIPLLDTYRVNHTFRKSLVNRYQLSYDSASLRVQMVSQSLNTSLVNLFNTTNSKNLATILSELNLTTVAYSNITAQLGQATAVTNDMYNFIQKQLATYFAINYATYSAPFFTNLNNILYIQNGIGATGVTSNYTTAYLESGQVSIDSTVPSFSNSPGFWPNFTSTNSNYYSSILDSDFANTISSSMYPYSVAASNFLYNSKVIDSNYYINTDKSTRTVNSLITVNPARYTIFKFRSPVRQTLQVETLPLPYYYRFADYNKGSNFQGVLDQFGSNMPAKYFDLSYSFVYNRSNALMDSSNYSSIVLSPLTFGIGYESPTIYTLTTLCNIHQFEFVAPYPSGTSNLVAYNTTLTFSTMMSASWAMAVQGYLYHDRGAFMADIKTARNENSNHYIARADANNTQSDLTFHFSTFAGHTYYGIFRSTNPAPANLISYSPSIYYPSPSYVEVQTDYTNFNPTANPYDASNAAKYPFVTNYNTDFLRLPVASTLWGLDPASSTFTEQIRIKQLPIGYDISGVSNDMTDYYGYVPGQKGFIPASVSQPLCIDPVSQYTFKSLSPFDPTTNSYFNQGSSNLLITTSNSQLYTFKGTSTSQTKIVHWYDGYSIPQQKSDKFGTNIVSSVTSSISDYIEGFFTDVDGNIQFGQGINAIGFMPTDASYSVDSFTFKSVLYPKTGTVLTSDDPNSKIAYVGVVRGATLVGANLNISSSLVLLKYTSSVVYAPQTQSNTPGFGVEFGTWYSYQRTEDTTYSNTNISGYTQGSNELLSYNSMYYFVPFDSNGVSITYSRLAGSLVPYPLSQVVSTGSTYFGQIVTQPPGSSNQSNYFMPSTIAGANPAYGAQGSFAYTQSQYQQSQPITTTSLGYKDYTLLVRNSDALFSFSTTLFTSADPIPTSNIGLTTAFTEYADSLYMLNSLKYSSTITNRALTFTGAQYASSISTSIATYGGTTDCIRYLVSSPSTLQNYSYVGLSSYFSSFSYQIQPGTNTSTTILSCQFAPSTTSATVWMWAGGGAANSNAGGAGAYVKANLNIQTLYSDYGISTIYMVVGKGGNRDNDSGTGTMGQMRYGGGGAEAGGGFSGLFMTSTLSSPILLVGGGGAGGVAALGGPGGFGPSQIPVQYYQFSTVRLSTRYYSTILISSIVDVDSNAFASGRPIASTIDRNLATYWQPTAAYINPTNFSPTVSTYRVNLQFMSNVSSFNRLRIYATGPTGLVVYNNQNKTQTLYSNTTTVTFSNSPQYFDAQPIPEIMNTTLLTNGWIVGGATQAATNMLQYSVDGKNWAQITNVGYSLPANSAMSILYASAFAKWFACGQRDKYTGNAGQGWGSPLIYNLVTIPSFVSTRVAVSGNGAYQYIANGGLYLNNVPNTTYTTGVTNVAVSGSGQYVLLSFNGIIYVSSNYGIGFNISLIPQGSQSSQWVFAISYYGQYMIVALNSAVYVSSNYGVNPLTNWSTPIFRPALPSIASIASVSISESGQYMLITLAPGAVYLSINFGITFQSIEQLGTENTVRASAINASGQYMVVATSSGLVAVSSDYGVRWIQPNPLPFGTEWKSVTMSSSGQYITLVGSTAQVSYTYGNTWVPSSGLRDAQSVFMSDDGKYQLAATLTGVYLSVAAEPNFTTSPILQSSDGLNWTPVTIPNQTTSQGFKTLALGSGQIVAGGIVGSNGGILSSANGITWTYRSCSFITEVSRIRYLSDGNFWGVSVNDFGLIKSSDGITWDAVSGSGSFNGCDITYGNTKYVIAQSGKGLPYVNALIYSFNGTIWTPASASSPANLLLFTAKTVAFGNAIFVAGGSTTDGTSCIKYSGDAISWSNANLTNLTINQTINEIKFAGSLFTAVGQCPSGTGRAPEQRSVLQSSDGIVWSNTVSGGFNSDLSNYAQTVDYGPLTIVPNVSTLYMEIQSATMPYIYEIQALNQLTIGAQRVQNTLLSMIDNSLTTSYWPRESHTVGITNYSLQFNFSTLTKLNKINFYLPSSLIGPTQGTAYFTGLSVVSPNTGSNVFSNTAITSNQFLQIGGNSLYIASLTSTVNVSSLSIDIFKTTTSSIQISEVMPVYDPNVGLSIPAGYSGGFSDTMSNSYVSYEFYNGGGGQSIFGGAGGLSAGQAGQGQYLLGGSPVVFPTTVNSAGGGGGGYYGGGGGGSTISGITNLGGAGGGGAGYTASENLVSLLDYGTALPATNYVVPGSNEQYNVLTTNAMTNCNYGQGGVAGVNEGQGQHGLILMTWISPVVVPPVNTVSAFPSYVDGKRLSLFHASIPGDNDAMRVLNFVTYTDSIQNTQYSNYNWVWYRSYLLLTGGTLLFPSMTPSIVEPSFPFTEFPSIPQPAYNTLAEVFSNVTSFFYEVDGKNASNITYIINAMKLSFDLLQPYFVATPYTAPNYVEMTELYGLLDYLQGSNTLLFPHVSGSNAPIDRIFGGVPRFGYWANPFLKNVSYLGFDMGPSLTAPSPLAAMTGSSNPVTAIYGVVLEQSLNTGVYEMKDIMAYKPTVADSAGSLTPWQQVTQFPESYVVRSLSNSFIQSNIPVQPYSMGAGISGRPSLFKYSVYTVATSIGSVPIHMINDFQGANVFLYTFNNTVRDNVSSIHLIQVPFTSTIIQMNQINIQSNSATIGTIVSQYPAGSSNQVVTEFGLTNSIPVIKFNTGPNNLYNSYPADPLLPSGSVGKAILDYVGNLYETPVDGSSLYQNTTLDKITMSNFIKPIRSVSPVSVLASYIANSNANPYYDFFVSKFTNIWQLQGTSNLSTVYGVRIKSPFDFTVTTNFINQVFYPTHKITLTNKGLSPNPIIDGLYLTNYPSYPRTEMFYYKNFSTLSNDISYTFAQEQSSNFTYTDTNSGYFLNSYINNINLSVSEPNLNDKNSFNYLAIRAYSPSEMFKTLVRFYLPGRYDFGYVSLNDLSGEALIIKTNPDVNPTYSNILSQFNQQFSTTQVFGANGYPGYPGSNIVSGGFGGFLSKYMNIYKVISSNAPIINAVNSYMLQGVSTLVNSDLQYILPSYIATRSRPTDPLEFSLPFSSITSYTNSGCKGNSNTSGQYGLGYNLGYSFTDTPYITVQRATSFFKILDDYIYLKMNPEYNMNRLDISRHEDFSSTHDSVAESQLYNCRLLLNTFGTYSTTFIQNPVVFNPPIGRLDKLSFTWYDSNGNLIDNAECDWSATLQIVERTDVMTEDSSAARL